MSLSWEVLNMYPFATFYSLDKFTLHSVCLKDLRLQKFKDRYWFDFDKDSIRVSKDTYEEIHGLMLECNKRNFALS